MAIQVDTPVQYIKGVGPKLGDLLRKRGAGTIGELLEWFPRTYEDRRAARSIASLEPEQIVSITAQVLSVKSIPMGKSHRKMYEVVIGDATGRIACKYFRVPYRGYFERFTAGQKVRVSGKVTLYRSRKEFHHPDIFVVGEEEDVTDVLLPIYTETEGLSPNKLRKILSTTLEDLNEEVVAETLPSWLLNRYQLTGRLQAYRQIHQPPSALGDQYLNFHAPAQRRIIFEEFFWLELHLALQKAGVQKEQGIPMPKEPTLLSRLLESLPFTLTGAQQRAYNEIAQDLKQRHPMHRLVQGDVGSGKTLVALMAALYAFENGSQTAIMVPTEILAEQHFKNAQKFLEPLGVKVGVLTGQMKNREHQQAIEAIAKGEVHVIVGTHALIQEHVRFHSLGLVVIDEQHRFGVDQRSELKSKGVSPHFLVMTATPIPRTLAMTVYGDLDVSIIDELPKGRSPIVTRKVFDNKRPQVMQFLLEQIAKGRQAYIIYPLVEESEKIDLRNALDEFERLQAELPNVRLGLLHGRMKPAEKEQVMRDFRDQKIQVLVATTVVEVGVDVPNANLMVIEHAERFGLSQLHQLRGRVGRGEHKSYCVLMLGYAVSDESRTRAEIMERTTDGFKIAEADLEMRGPGEFLGRRQSGLPGFKMANLVRDVNILKEARQAAFEIVAGDPDLKKPENHLLRQHLSAKVALSVG